jgi:hypothetical protein
VLEARHGRLRRVGLLVDRQCRGAAGDFVRECECRKTCTSRHAFSRLRCVSRASRSRRVRSRKSCFVSCVRDLLLPLSDTCSSPTISTRQEGRHTPQTGAQTWERRLPSCDRQRTSTWLAVLQAHTPASQPSDSFSRTKSKNRDRSTFKQKKKSVLGTPP